MREKILIDALEWLKKNYTLVLNSEKYMNLGIEKIEKALSDYASQKEGMETPSQIFFKHLDKQRKKGDALLFKHIEPVIYAAMEEYAAQFQSPSSAPESGGEQQEGIFDDNEMWHPQRYASATPPTKESGGDEKDSNITPELLAKLNKDFGPEVQSSDKTSVASHSVYDNNSVEQLKTKIESLELDKNYSSHHHNGAAMMKEMILKLMPNIEYEFSASQDWRSVTELTGPKGVILVYFKTGKVFAYDCDHSNGKAIRNVIEQNKSALYKQIILPNSEQKDKRSVASKADSSNDAGNQKRINL